MAMNKNEYSLYNYVDAVNVAHLLNFAARKFSFLNNYFFGTISDNNLIRFKN